MAPSIIQMLDENDMTIRNDTIIGPLSEGQRFVSYCEARSGRPRPIVGWYHNNKRLPRKYLSANKICKQNSQTKAKSKDIIKIIKLIEQILKIIFSINYDKNPFII